MKTEGEIIYTTDVDSDEAFILFRSIDDQVLMTVSIKHGSDLEVRLGKTEVEKMQHILGKFNSDCRNNPS